MISPSMTGSRLSHHVSLPRGRGPVFQGCYPSTVLPGLAALPSRQGQPAEGFGSQPFIPRVRTERTSSCATATARPASQGLDRGGAND